MSQEVQQTDLGKAFSMTGAAAAIWWKAITRRNGNSRKLRTELKNVRFRSHAKIREEQLAEFCQRFRKDRDLRLDAYQVPATCLENSLGGPAYYLSLAAVAASLQPRQIVEFGTFLGHGALVFAMNAPNARILTIDLPDEVDGLSNLNRTDQSHVHSSSETGGANAIEAPHVNRRSRN